LIENNRQKEGTIMKNFNKVLIGLLAAAMVMTMALPAMASKGCNASGGDVTGFITTHPTAPGTKWSGPLTIYYEDIPGIENTCGADAPQKMTFFTRMRKGATILPFAGEAPCVDYVDDSTIQGAIEEFFEVTVIPILTGDSMSATYCDPACSAADEDAGFCTGSCPPFLVKNVDQYVQDVDPGGGEPDCCGDIFFEIMDITIAIQD